MRMIDVIDHDAAAHYESTSGSTTLSVGFYYRFLSLQSKVGGSGKIGDETEFRCLWGQVGLERCVSFHPPLHAFSVFSSSSLEKR